LFNKLTVGFEYQYYWLYSLHSCYLFLKPGQQEMYHWNSMRIFNIVLQW